MKIEGLGRAKRAVMRAKEILISGHVNPDGDSIGSLLSLGMGLERLGKRVYMVSCDGVPHKYMGLPGAGRIIKNVDKPVDLAISVDCSSKEILGPTYSAFQKAGKILEIDHHAFRRPFGDIALLDNKAAAVGELVYIFLSGLGVVITKDIAQNLMTSIIVETNSFRLPKVRPFTFQTCTKLVDIDIDFYKLVDMIFWSMRRESAILSGICMSRCKFLKGGRIAWSIIRKRDFDAANGRDEDVDAVPDEMRSIRSVKIALLFREANTGVLRVSLRSKNSVNVANLAEYYNGGGHFDVAGCSIPNDAGAIKEFLNRASRLIG